METQAEHRMPPHQTMQFFAFDHLPPDKQTVSKPFGELAQLMDDILSDNPEKSAMMRKLVEAKDCAVRAGFFKWPKKKQESQH